MRRRRTYRRREGLHYHHVLTNVQPWLSFIFMYKHTAACLLRYCLSYTLSTMNKSVRFRSYSAHHVLVLAWCSSSSYPGCSLGQDPIPEDTNQDRIPPEMWWWPPSRTLEMLRTVAASSQPHPWTSPQWRWDVPQTCGKLMAWHPIQDFPRWMFHPLNQRLV